MPRVKRARGKEVVDSSSEQLPKFRNEACKEKYDYLSTKTVNKGKTLNPTSEFHKNDLTVYEMFEHQGLLNILAIQNPVYPDLVYQFYANMAIPSREPGETRHPNSFTTRVDGVEFEVDEEKMAQWFNMYTGAECVKISVVDSIDEPLLNQKIVDLTKGAATSYKSLKMTHLDLDARLVARVIFYSILCITGAKGVFSRLQAYLMLAILLRTNVAWPHFFIHNMKDGKRTTLPYGMLLTEIFKINGIDLSDHHHIPFDKRNDHYSPFFINQMGFMLDNGRWIEKRGNRAAEEEENPPLTEMQQILQGMAGLNDNVQRYNDNVQGYRDDVHNYRSDVQDYRNDVQGLRTDVAHYQTQVDAYYANSTSQFNEYNANVTAYRAEIAALHNEQRRQNRLSRRIDRFNRQQFPGTYVVSDSDDQDPANPTF